MEKNYGLFEMVTREDGESDGSMVIVAFDDREMSGYFMDWFNEVGRESFDAAIMDL